MIVDDLTKIWPDGKGDGYLLIHAGQIMETEKVFASLVVLAVAGAVVIKLEQLIDHTRWRRGRLATIAIKREKWKRGGNDELP